MRLYHKTAFALAIGLIVSWGNESYAAILGPTPYLSFSDSPFSGESFSYFFLEDFEDGLFNTPGVSASAGGVTSVVFGPNIHDSVDADDGVIDGSGLSGDSYFSPSGSEGILFTFDADVLGSLPDSAGLVWTDGAGTTFFEASGPGGISLGTVGPVEIADGFGLFGGETGEDRFFGVSGLGAIESIFISNVTPGIEIDHLQYGLTASVSDPTPGTSIPEPATSIFGLLTVAGMTVTMKRKGT